MIGMVDTIVPITSAFWEIRVVADHVQCRFENAVLPGHGIGRHEENVADAFAANFVDKFIEGGGVGEVGVGVGLDAVAVTTADEELVPLVGESLDLAILSPAAQAVQFHCMDEGGATGHELVDAEAMPIDTDLVQIPHGMVEDDQYVRYVMQVGENLLESGNGRGSSEVCEGLHPGRRGCLGKIVYSEMKDRVAIRSCPFDCDWDTVRAGRAQEQRCLDVVMIGDGDESRELQCVFNLAAFKIESELRRQRRGPIAGLVIEFESEFPAVALAVRKDGTEDLVFASHVSKKIQGFPGQAGVAVKGDAGSEFSGSVSFTPGVRDA